SLPSRRDSDKRRSTRESRDTTTSNGHGTPLQVKSTKSVRKSSSRSLVCTGPSTKVGHLPIISDSEVEEEMRRILTAIGASSTTDTADSTSGTSASEVQVIQLKAND